MILLIFELTAYNRAYLPSCFRHSAKIQPNGWTSTTRRTVSEILGIDSLGDSP